MKYFLFAAVCTLLVSCAPTPVTTTTEIEEVQLSQRDTNLVLDAVRTCDGETGIREILTSERWGKEDNAEIYRIVLDDPNTSEQPKAYKMAKFNGTWKVLGTTF